MELKIGPQDPLYKKIDIFWGPLYSLTFCHLLTLEAVGGGQGTYTPPPLQ